MKKLGVIYGGSSTEHDISVMSAKSDIINTVPSSKDKIRSRISLVYPLFIFFPYLCHEYYILYVT